MTLSKAEALARVIEKYGGNAEPPTVRHAEVREPEIVYVNQTRRFPDAWGSVYVPILDGFALSNWTPNIGPSVRKLQFDRREWVCREWISTMSHITAEDMERRDVYDPKTNVLTLCGYWRVYKFTVWQEHTPQEREESEK